MFCLSFVVCYGLLSVVRCLLFVDCCVPTEVSCLGFVKGCLLLFCLRYVVCCSLFMGIVLRGVDCLFVCCWLFVARCSLSVVVRCFLCTGCCLLSV